MSFSKHRTHKSLPMKSRVLAVVMVATLLSPLPHGQAEIVGRHVRAVLDSTVDSLRGAGRPLNKTSYRVQHVMEASDRATAVTRVSLCPRRLLLYVGEEYTLSPLPFDSQGEPVQGVVFTWESSDISVAEVVSDGTIIALETGKCFVTASVGHRSDKVKVEVREGKRPFLNEAQWDAEHVSDCDKPEKSPEDSAISTPGISAVVKRPRIEPAIVLEPDDPAGISGAGNAANATGHPRFNANLSLQSSVASTDNQLASYNFNFTMPIFGLTGRGVDTGLTLAYNSRMWTKDGNKIVFDYDQGWPAAGFRLNYGRIVPNFDAALPGFPGNYLLIEGDGTRTPLLETFEGSQVYRSQDGRFIEFNNTNSSDMKLTYPDGTAVTYEFNGSKLLPRKIQDINTNSIVIDYVTSCSDALRVESCTCGSGGTCVRPPRQAIKHITDTQGRIITFHYYANGHLAEIRVPGYNNGPSRTLVKFYYDQTFTLSYNFDSSLQVVGAPSDGRVDVLKRIYFPDTKRGYVFSGYSGYGMYTKASSRVAMTDSTEGFEVAYTEYVYQINGAQTDAPGYSQRKEWWQGKTDDSGNPVTTPAVYNYDRQSTSSTLTSTVTGPDQVQTVMISNNSPSSPQFGTLQTMKIIDAQGATRFEQNYTYTIAVTHGGLQRTQLDVIPDGVTANQTRTESSFGQFGRLMELREYGFRDGGSFKLRRLTSYTYFDGGAGYTDLGLLQLIREVKVFDTKLNGDPADDVLIARTRYTYDDNSNPDWSLEKYGLTHGCSPPSCPAPPGFNTNKLNRVERGNISLIELWSNATSANPDISFRHRYDVFGNEVKAELSCCSLRRVNYAAGISGSHYSKPQSVIDGPTAGPTLTTSYIYDFGTCFLNSMTDEQGQVTNYTPDSAMRLRTTTLPKLASDPNPNPTLETFYPPDPGFGNQEGLTYQQKTTYMDGPFQKTTVTNQWFDGAGRVIRAGTGVGASPSSFDAAKSIYDELGRLRKTTNPYTTTNSNGDTTGLPNSTVYDYDAMGRVKFVTLPGGNTVQTDYNGAETTITDQVGRKRKSQMDGLGRIITVTEQDPANGNLGWATSYTYDLLNNLVQVNQGGQTRAYKYDSLSRLGFERTPEQDATINDGTGTFWSAKYSYTSFNEVLKRTDARGVETNYRYDGLNRLDQISYTGPGGGPLPALVEATTTISVTYNNLNSQVSSNGLVSFITDGAGREDYAYDGLSRVSSKTRLVGPNSYTTTYEYNQMGQLAVMVYPSNKRVRINYDSQGRMSGIDKVNTSGSVLTTYLSNIGYNSAGQISGDTVGHVITESFGYNNRLQMTSQTATKVNGPANGLMNLAYNYDAQASQSGASTSAGNSGQLMAITGTINGAARGQSFTYDNVARLKTASGPWAGGQINYSYDRWGNRTAASGGQTQNVAMQQPGGVTNNRIATVNNVAYEYDAAGNLTSDNGTSNRYRYDAENRLVKVDGTNVIYTYDSENRRVKKEVGGVTTVYVWEDSQVIAEYTNGAATGSGLNYYLADRLSTRLKADSSGNVAGTQDHYPFGEDASATGAVEKHKFTNYERDAEIGSDYAVNRQYSNLTGRFMRPDPMAGDIANPQSLNRYAYVKNDPVNLIDPLGLFSVDCQTYVSGTLYSIDGRDILFIPTEVRSVCIFRVGFDNIDDRQSRGKVFKRPMSPQNLERYCNALAQTIANIKGKILQSKNHIDVNPGDLPETAPGPRRNSIQGHRELLQIQEENLKRREQEYKDNCGGGPPPNLAPKTPPVILPPGYKYPKPVIPRVMRPVPVRPSGPGFLFLPPGIIRCILFNECGGGGSKMA